MENTNLKNYEVRDIGAIEMECRKLEEQLLAIHKTILEMRKATATQKNVNKTTKDGMQVIAHAVDAGLEGKSKLMKIAQERSYSETVKEGKSTTTPTNKRTRDKVSPLTQNVPSKRKKDRAHVTTECHKTKARKRRKNPHE